MVNLRPLAPVPQAWGHARTPRLPERTGRKDSRQRPLACGTPAKGATRSQGPSDVRATLLPHSMRWAVAMPPPSERSPEGDLNPPWSAPASGALPGISYRDCMGARSTGPHARAAVYATPEAGHKCAPLGYLLPGGARSPSAARESLPLAWADVRPRGGAVTAAVASQTPACLCYAETRCICAHVRTRRLLACL